MSTFIVCWLCHFCSNWRSPPECPLSKENITYIFVEADKKEPDASQTCYILSSRNDPSLAIMLTQVWHFTLTPEERKILYCLLTHSLLLTPLQEERSLAARHMLEFSMGLLGLCFALCLVASLSNSLLRHKNWNEPLQEHVTLWNLTSIYFLYLLFLSDMSLSYNSKSYSIKSTYIIQRDLQIFRLQSFDDVVIHLYFFF